MNLEDRIIDLEMHLARQERLSDELSAEILRLNKLIDTLHLRIEAHEARDAIKSLAEETPPPHY